MAGRRLNCKHYIVAVLMAMLVTAGIITGVFAVLSPAHVHFSVTHAGHRRVSGGGGDRAHRLSLALSATNPSRLAAVRYLGMYIDVRNSTSSTAFFSADVATPMPLSQPTRNVTTIAASWSLAGGPHTEAFTGNMTSDLVVIVNAVARFKVVGIAWTRLYYIRAYCWPIDFFSSPGSSAGFPVDCKTT